VVTVEQREVSPQEVAVIDVLRRQVDADGRDVRGRDVNGHDYEGWLAHYLVAGYVKGICPRTRTRTVRRVLDRLIDDGLVEAGMVGGHLSFRWSPRRPL
jgi:hypothetical protein